MENNRLSQIAQLVKNQIFIISLIFLALLIFALFIFRLTTRPAPYEGVRWINSITPGQTTTEQLKKSLGEPLSQSGNTLNYSSSNQYRPITINTTNDKVSLIIEPVIKTEKGQLSDFIKLLGQPEAIVYGEHQAAAPGHFWGAKGILVFGNPISNIILEIWYFPPTTLDSFLVQYPDIKTETETNKF